MAEVTKISWTDATFNPWQGCVKVSPACRHCYAERDTKRFGKVRWGQSGTRVLTSEAYWKKPLKWNRDAQSAGVRKRVFCASLADVFEDWEGRVRQTKGKTLVHTSCGWQEEVTEQHEGCSRVTINDCRKRLFHLIDATPNLDWLLLTKRPENILRMWVPYFPGGYIAEAGSMNQEGPRKNVWLGTSVENQVYADKRIPELLKCRHLAPVLFLSCEPLLGPVDLMEIHERTETGDRFYSAMGTGSPEGAKIDWVIAGGESGPDARPTDADWLRSLRDQCVENDVPFHFKQWGEFDQNGVRSGKKAAGNTMDGVLHLEFPQG